MEKHFLTEGLLMTTQLWESAKTQIIQVDTYIFTVLLVHSPKNISKWQQILKSHIEKLDCLVFRRKIEGMWVSMLNVGLSIKTFTDIHNVPNLTLNKASRNFSVTSNNTCQVL